MQVLKTKLLIQFEVTWQKCWVMRTYCTYVTWACNKVILFYHSTIQLLCNRTFHEFCVHIQPQFFFKLLINFNHIKIEKKKNWWILAMLRRRNLHHKHWGTNFNTFRVVCIFLECRTQLRSTNIIFLPPCI